MFLELFLIRKRIIRLFKGLFKPSDLVVDIGCGSNPYYHESIKAKIVCTDIGSTKKTHIVGDAMHMPFSESKFDGVVCVNSLYYHKNPFRSISEFSIILKKNAKLVLVTPFIYPIHDIPTDKYRFTEYGIREILKDDFIVKEVKVIGGIFNVPVIFFHSLIKGAPMMFPKNMKRPLSFISAIILYPFYIISQLISILDFLDTSGRWPTFYFTVAVKK